MKSVKMLESDEDEEEEGNKKETKGMNGDIEKGNSRDEPRKLFWFLLIYFCIAFVSTNYYYSSRAHYYYSVWNYFYSGNFSIPILNISFH